jgi:hypothetical protein
MHRLLPALAVLLLGGPALAGGVRGVTVEVTGGPGWRAAFSNGDRAPGFEALTGGAEALAGLDLGVVGVVVGGRFRGGAAGGARYLEAAGDFALQLFLGERVRARIGFDAGWASLPDGSSPLVGGFAALSFDVFAFSAGRAALALSVRFDADGFLTDAESFPRSSLALGIGAGFRY